jgi:hypothetical protein
VELREEEGGEEEEGGAGARSGRGKERFLLCCLHNNRFHCEN